MSDLHAAWHIRALLAVRLEAERVSEKIDDLYTVPVHLMPNVLSQLKHCQGRLNWQLENCKALDQGHQQGGNDD